MNTKCIALNKKILNPVDYLLEQAIDSFKRLLHNLSNQSQLSNILYIRSKIKTGSDHKPPIFYKYFEQLKELVGEGKITEYDCRWDNGKFDVYESIRITKKIDTLPFPFGIILGDFDVYGIGLTTLENCPVTVCGNFDCTGNKLTSLEGAPQTVGGHFGCNGNDKLTSLEGAPKTVNGDFITNHNGIKFTKEQVGAVSKVNGEIYV